MKSNDVLLPVANMNVRDKASARLNDDIIIETWIEKYNSLSVTFGQLIKSKKDEKIFIKAEFDVVAINEAGKLYRRFPEVVVNALKKSEE